MSTAELLRKTVADFFEVNEGQVGPFFSLQGRRGQGSISRACARFGNPPSGRAHVAVDLLGEDLW